MRYFAYLSPNGKDFADSRRGPSGSRALCIRFGAFQGCKVHMVRLNARSPWGTQFAQSELRNLSGVVQHAQHPDKSGAADLNATRIPPDPFRG